MPIIYRELRKLIRPFQRIKGDQIQKQLKEEKDVMADQITALNSHIDAQEQVIKKLEERERSLQSTLVGLFLITRPFLTENVD